MDITVSDPQLLEDGRINCIVDLGRGPMPYTATADDTSPWGPAIFAAAMDLGPEPYVAPVPDPVADLAAERAQMRVTRLQAKAALYNAGLLPSVEAFIATQDFLTQLAWAETDVFTRTGATVTAIATALNITETALDDLFRAGALLTF